MSGVEPDNGEPLPRARVALSGCSDIVRVAAIGLALASQLACGGGGAESAPLEKAEMRVDAGAGAAASSGRAADGSAGEGSASTASMLAANLTLRCGAARCAPPKNVASELLRGVTGLPMTGADTVACCLDADAGICSSAASASGTCDAVAVSDDRCPGVDLSALAALVGGLGERAQEAMIGCCTHGMCGLDGKLFGRGCVENAEAKRMLSSVPVIGPLIRVPAPRSCADEPVSAGQSDDPEVDPAAEADADAGA